MDSIVEYLDNQLEDQQIIQRVVGGFDKEIVDEVVQYYNQLGFMATVEDDSHARLRSSKRYEITIMRGE